MARISRTLDEASPTFSGSKPLCTAVQKDDGLLIGSSKIKELKQDGGDNASFSTESTTTPISNLFSAVDALELSRISQGEFDQLLGNHGIDAEKMSQGIGSRTSRELLQEVKSRRCRLEQLDGCRIQRCCSILMVQIEAQHLGKAMFLSMSPDGEKECQQLSAIMFSDESPQKALGRCLCQAFGFKEDAVWKYFDILGSTQRDEKQESRAYHGLTSRYNIHEFHVVVCDPRAPALSSMGLPSGKDFTTPAKHGSSQPFRWWWIDMSLLRVIKQTSTRLELSRRRPSETLFDLSLNVPQHQHQPQCCIIS